MPEPHRLSYMGDPALVESFLEILARHGLVHIPDAAPAATPEPGMDYDASDPYSIVASGSYDTASTDIAHAIADFTTRFPGRARIYDGGAMPSGGLLTFRGRHELIDDFYPLLAFEDVEVMDPQEDDDWASVDQQIEADPTGDAAIEMQVIGGKDLPRHASLPSQLSCGNIRDKQRSSSRAIREPESYRRILRRRQASFVRSRPRSSILASRVALRVQVRPSWRLGPGARRPVTVSKFLGDDDAAG